MTETEELSEMSDRTKLTQLKTWRALDRAERVVLLDRARFLARLLQKYRREDVSDFMIRQATLKTSTVNHYLRLADAYLAMPDERIWIALDKVGIISLAKLEDETLRKAAIKDIIEKSKSLPEGVVPRCFYRQLFMNHGLMKEAEEGRCFGSKRMKRVREKLVKQNDGPLTSGERKSLNRAQLERDMLITMIIKLQDDGVLTKQHLNTGIRNIVDAHRSRLTPGACGSR